MPSTPSLNSPLLSPDSLLVESQCPCFVWFNKSGSISLLAQKDEMRLDRTALLCSPTLPPQTLTVKLFSRQPGRCRRRGSVGTWKPNHCKAGFAGTFGPSLLVAESGCGCGVAHIIPSVFSSSTSSRLRIAPLPDSIASALLSQPILCCSLLHFTLRRYSH